MMKIQFVVSCGVVVPFSQLCDDASPGQQEVAVRNSVEAMLGHDAGETDAGTEVDD